MSGCKELKNIACSNNQINSIDISDCPWNCIVNGDENITIIGSKSFDEGEKTATGQSSSSENVVTTSPTYSCEWVDGKWYEADGSQTYTGTLTWKSDGTGYWVEDSSGWYPQDKWQKIDSVWYYFKSDGYMAAGEWYNGYYFEKNGAYTYTALLMWKSDGKGWWVEDTSGWYPANSWQKIDGNWYYFGGDGYMVTNQYVDGYWIDGTGICK